MRWQNQWGGEIASVSRWFHIIAISANVPGPQGKAMAAWQPSIMAETPIAFADCFAAALAQLRDCAVVTGDREFQRLEGVVQVEWL